MKTDKLIDAIGQIDDEYIEEAHKETKKRFEFRLNWTTFGKIAAAACVLLLVINIFPVFFHSFAMSGGAKDSASPAEYGGSYYYNNSGGGYAEESVQAAPAMEEAEMVYDEEAKAEGNTSALRENKKLILTSYMTMETQDMDELLDKINAMVSASGGYIQRSSIYNQNTNSRSYDACIRIPAANYTSFLESLKGEGNALYYSEETRDVTDSYTDIQARLSSLKAQEAKVLEFYDKAEDLQDLITVESRLSDIRYQIESYEAQIKNYDLLISYSTLNLTINETKVYTPTSPSFFERLGSAFTRGFSRFVDGIEDFILDIVYNIWTILFLAVLGFIGYRLYRRFRNKRK